MNKKLTMFQLIIIWTNLAVNTNFDQIYLFCLDTQIFDYLNVIKYI